MVLGIHPNMAVFIYLKYITMQFIKCFFFRGIRHKDRNVRVIQQSLYNEEKNFIKINLNRELVKD